MEFKTRALITLACITILTGCSPPKDAKMIDRFNQKKAIFEALVRMVGEDNFRSHLWITNLNEKPASLSDARAKQYKALLEQADLTGIMRMDPGGKTDRIILFTKAPFLSTEIKSYVHAQNPLTPLLESLDDGLHEFKPYVSYYKHIEGNWYLEYAIING